MCRRLKYFDSIDTPHSHDDADVAAPEAPEGEECLHDTATKRRHRHDEPEDCFLQLEAQLFAQPKTSALTESTTTEQTLAHQVQSYWKQPMANLNLTEKIGTPKG